MGSAAPSAQERSSLAGRAARAYRWLGPVLSLASGVASVVLARRGVDFAPAAVAILVVAWTLAAFFFAPAAARAEPRGADPGRAARLLRLAATTLISGLYQNVLFFLVPVWAGAATWPSPNVVAPVLLGLLAVGSCFDAFYFPHVLARPTRRAVVSAAVLCAALITATPVFFSTLPLRPNLAVAGAVSAVLGALSALPRERLRAPSTLAGVAGAALLTAGLLAAAAPLLPPVPLDAMEGATAAALLDRRPSGVSSRFAPGVERVYAWFSVSAPRRYEAKLRIVWFHDGVPLGPGFETEIVGGRKSGFRTYSYVRRPAVGAWRVDVVADSGQLLARQRFEVR